MREIILYTIGCPKCVVLEKKLKAANIPFCTVTDIDTIKKTGFTAVPILKVDGNYMEFAEAVKWINEEQSKK